MRSCLLISLLLLPAMAIKISELDPENDLTLPEAAAIGTSISRAHQSRCNVCLQVMLTKSLNC